MSKLNDFKPNDSSPLVVAYGGGVDSTSMLVLLVEQGIKPDLILFADTGGEKPETLEYIPVMNAYLAKHDFPQIEVVKKLTLDSTSYNDLTGNCLDNETLPSLAFGMKSCSIKWKHQPQDKYLMGAKRGPMKGDAHPVWIDAQERGVKPIKLIGYDASPADIRRAKNAPVETEDFLYWYPLIDLDIKRPQCIEIIIRAGLPVPIKSACFFCPASKKWELYWLAGTSPHLFEKALEMEVTAMTGHHTRFDEIEMGAGFMELIGSGDRWPSTKTTVGLGRTFAWNHWARMNGVCDSDGKVIMDPVKCLELSDELKAETGGGNAADRRDSGKVIKVVQIEPPEQQLQLF